MKLCQFVFVILFVFLFGAGFIPNFESELVGQLLITEVYYDTPGDDGREEWVEIANVGTAVIDLSDMKIGDEEVAGGGEGMKRFPEGAQIWPGQAVVVAQTAVGFRALFGFNPHFEIVETDASIPNMRNFPLMAKGELALANDGDELVLVDGMAIIDAISYGDSTTFNVPAIPSVFRGQSIERVPSNCDTDSAADWQPSQTPTPGTIVLDDACTWIDPATLESLPSVGEIQGATDVSPLLDQEVSFRGVVTGWREDRNARGVTYFTLFVQDVPGSEDGDARTSDGIAVFLGRKRPSFQPGNQLRITGIVTEFYGYTEIDDDNLQIIIEAEDVPLPDPVPLLFTDADFESLESMQVVLPNEMVAVGPTYSGCGFAVGEGNGRIFQRDETPPAEFVLPILHTSDIDCAGFPQIKTGDRLTGLSGILVYQFDQFRLLQLDATSLTIIEAPWPELLHLPKLVDSQVMVASLNLENYFDDRDDTGDDAEPIFTLAEIEMKQQKLAYLVGDVLRCPTLLGVQEVEHAHLLHGLAKKLQTSCGFQYAITHLESPDVRGIDVALLANPHQVEVLESLLQQTCTPIETGIYDPAIDCEGLQQPLFSRPPLQVDVLVGERPFTILINHFKSKRGGAAETAPRRLLQAQHINQLVRELLIENPEANIIVMGDFNDYEQSQSLREMTVKGHLTNPLLNLPEDERYSYVFSGISQLIDGILVSPKLVENVEKAGILHVNADFPYALAEDTTEQAILYRASDHDVPYLLLSLEESDVDGETAVYATSSPNPDPTPIDDFDPIKDDSTNHRFKIIIGSGIGILALALLTIKQKFKA
ncbi:MAG: hypothetical protein DWQ04_01215 [Chloroflexi bacterium]|nr:MAG: hypothetical protein DWQ04_01215 [Chloroflexota bacterium]